MVTAERGNIRPPLQLTPPQLPPRKQTTPAIAPRSATAPLPEAVVTPTTEPPPYDQAMAPVAGNSFIVGRDGVLSKSLAASAGGVDGLGAVAVGGGVSGGCGGNGTGGSRGGGSTLEKGGNEPATHVGEGSDGGGGIGDISSTQGDAGGGSVEPALALTTSTANISTGELGPFSPAYRGRGFASPAYIAEEPKPTPDELGTPPPANRRSASGKPTVDEIETSSAMGRRRSSGSLGLGQAVGDAAGELARNCQFPGVTEAATAVSILVNLLNNNRDNKMGSDASLRRCRSIIMMLQRASTVLGKVTF